MSKRRLITVEPPSPILVRALSNSGRPMPLTAAREVMRFGFEQADQDRIRDLMARNNEGKLSAAELAELKQFAMAANIVAILQSQARMAIKRAGKKK
jgi:hypothetical protein